MSYAKEFYATRNEETVYAARRVCSILIEKIPSICSAVDWLSVLQEMGVKDIQGIDGSWVDQNMLVIPKDNFLEDDLTKAKKITRRFDLAVCLEVAEHLPRECANDFIRWLTELSDIVLFSAAIPFQGGVNHMNEAWHSYWIELFGANDYHLYDFIRARIWNDSQIPFWYRQNIILFVKTNSCHKLNYEGVGHLPIDIVHPELFLSKCKQQPVSSSFLRRLVNVINRTFKSVN